MSFIDTTRTRETQYFQNPAQVQGTGTSANSKLLFDFNNNVSNTDETSISNTYSANATKRNTISTKEYLTIITNRLLMLGLTQDEISAFIKEGFELHKFIRTNSEHHKHKPITHEELNKLTNILNEIIPQLRNAGKEINLYNFGVQCKENTNNNLISFINLNKGKEITKDDVEKANLGRVFCYSLNAKKLDDISQEELNRYMECVRLAQEDYETIKGNSELGIQELAFDYYTCKDETRRNELREKVLSGYYNNKSFRAQFGYKPGEIISHDEFRERIQTQVMESVLEIESIQDEKQQEEKRKELGEKQLNNLIDTLHASSLEDRKILIHYLETSLDKGMFNAMKAKLKENMPAEEYAAFFAEMKPEDFRKARGNMQGECQILYSQEYGKHSTFTNVQEAHSYDSQRAGELKKKIDNGTATEEEIAQYETLTGQTSALEVGAAQNEYYSLEEREVLLQQCYYENTQHGIERDVLTKNIEYAANYPQDSNLTKEQFEALMNKASNNNYTIVANDIKNGTVTKLNEPIEPETTNSSVNKKTTTKSKTSLGYSNSDSLTTTAIIEAQVQNQNAVAELYNNTTSQNNEIADNSATESTQKTIHTDIAKVARQGWSAVVTELKENGQKAKKELFNSIGQITNQGVVAKVVGMYQRETASKQAKILTEISDNGSFKKFFSNSKESAKVLAAKETFTNFYKTKLVKDEYKEIKEEDKQNAYTC